MEGETTKLSSGGFGDGLSDDLGQMADGAAAPIARGVPARAGLLLRVLQRQHARRDLDAQVEPRLAAPRVQLVRREARHRPRHQSHVRG